MEYKQKMKDITFILSSLNNGYDNTVNDPVKNYHQQRTVFFVQRLKKFNAKVVFIDWCSDEESKYRNFLPTDVKYIYIPKLILNELHKNNNCTMNFYEWISKDIGAYYSETKNLLFTNGDNLFSKQLFEEIVNLNTDNTWYSGKRINIDNEVFKDKITLENLLENDPGKFKVLDECDFCFGDFTLINRVDYERVGGYNYSHVHAFEDSILAEKLKHTGILQKSINSPFYHLNHSKASRCKIFSNSPIDKNAIKNAIINNAEISLL
jgi:hypothetical protein